MYRFVIFEAADGWRWHLKAANGEIVAQGEAYTRRRDCVRAIRAVKVGVYRATVE
jgi:uncharacterized protein YegP (UPF0339 family)